MANLTRSGELDLMECVTSCAGCDSLGVQGALCRADMKFYCNRCWKSSSGKTTKQNRLPCTGCHRTVWVDADLWLCDKCSCSSPPVSGNPPTPVVVDMPRSDPPTATSYSTNCAQCSSTSALGFVSRYDERFYCSNCWKGFSKHDRLPCPSCGGRGAGSIDARGKFRCASCAHQCQNEARAKASHISGASTTPQSLAWDVRKISASPAFSAVDRCVWRFALSFELQQSAIDEAIKICSDIDEAFKPHGLGFDIYGSRRTGIVSTRSDFDFHVKAAPTTTSSTSHEMETPSPSALMSTVARALRSKPHVFETVSVTNASVPLVECKHRATGCELDFSFFDSGVSGALFQIKKLTSSSTSSPLTPLARPLLVVVKSLLRRWGLASSGDGLGSFAVFTMVAWLLDDHHPRFRTTNSDSGDNTLDSTLVGLHGLTCQQCKLSLFLLYFLFYYGHYFCSASCGIDIIDREIVRKPRSTSGKLFLLHAVDRHSNAASTCHKYESQVRPKFAAAFETLFAALTSTDAIGGENACAALLDVSLGTEKGVHTLGRKQNEWGPFGIYVGGLGL